MNDIIEAIDCRDYKAISKLCEVITVPIIWNWCTDKTIQPNFITFLINTRNLEIIAFFCQKYPISSHILLQASMYPGNLDIIQYLGPKNFNSYHGTILCNACQCGDIDVLRYMTDLKVDIRADNNRALICACESGHLEIVKYLVDSGANIDARQLSPLILACKNGHYDIVKYLLEKNASVDSIGDSSLSLYKKMTNACAEIECVERLYSTPFSTPLSSASENHHYKIIDILIEKGAYVYEAFCCVCHKGDLEMVQYLINYLPDLHYNEDIALFRACENNHVHVVKYLLQQFNNTDYSHTIYNYSWSDEITEELTKYNCRMKSMVKKCTFK